MYPIISIHSSFITSSVLFNEQFNWVASASMNGTVIIYDYDTNRIRQELQHNGGVIRMRWHPNTFVLVTGCLDGCIYVWDARNGRNLYTLSGHTVGYVIQ